MGQQLHGRSAGSSRRLRRVALTALPLVAVLALSGCSEEAKNLAMPSPITEEGKHVLSLWQGAWIAALLTGAVVWGLIFYVVVRYRRRSDDEIPVQTRYNLPLEIFYTIFPIVMVVVFFSHTVRVQNLVLDDSPPDNTLYIVGQQWSWTFNYPDAVDGQNVYKSGTGNDMPTLYLPVGETTRFELRTPDVIHDFGVPGFLIKMDVMPGQKNHFQVTPQTEGVYKGKCYELCGVYHSRMLFNVEVVPRDEYEARLQELADAGNVTDEPVLGGKFNCTQVGLETDVESEEACR